MKNILLIVLISTFPLFIFGQYSTKSKKAIKKYENALENFQNFKYTEALKYSKEAIEEDKNMIEVYFLLSDIYSKTGENLLKISALRNAILIDPEYSVIVYMILSKSLLSIGIYDEALKNLKEFDKRNDVPEYNSEILYLYERCNFGANAVKNPVPFVPKNLGSEINTVYDDYHPVLTVDEQTIIYTIGVPKPGITEIITQADSQEDFFISKKDKTGKWTKSQNFGNILNTLSNEGAHTITADGNTMYFTACEDISKVNPHGKSFGSCDIFFSKKEGNSWSKSENAGASVNSSAWESQPSISNDGRVLYFVSSRKGGKGGKDIWFCKKNDDGTWGKAINMGDSINTIGNEQSPFIHADNQTFYFASDGHVGMGNSDLFISRKSKSGNWTKPINIGYPINTYDEQTGISVNSLGTKGYFAAKYETGIGRMDIYEFEIPLKIQPNPVTYVQGIVYDAVTNEKLEAKFVLTNLITKEISAESVSDKINGKFLVCLPSGNEYSLIVEKQGYLFHSENFMIEKSKDSMKIFYLDIPLQPVQFGEKVILKNIFFAYDSFVLEEKSFAELDKLVDFLNKNLSLKIEIGGHTDNSGTNKHNKELSENRAKSVYNYLISKNIDKMRISFKGYADEVPISDNSTEKGRRENRRTEFIIVK